MDSTISVSATVKGPTHNDSVIQEMSHYVTPLINIEDVIIQKETGASLTSSGYKIYYMDIDSPFSIMINPINNIIVVPPAYNPIVPIKTIPTSVNNVYKKPQFILPISIKEKNPVIKEQHTTDESYIYLYLFLVTIFIFLLQRLCNFILKRYARKTKTDTSKSNITKR